MQRRDFVAALGAAAQPGGGARRNLLLIVVDGQRSEMMGCAGNRLLKTPNIDALAGRSVRFENSFCAHSVCMPSRASILTGRYPSVHGVWWRRSATDAKIQCMKDAKWVFAAFCFVFSALAQVDTGTVAGTLTDSTGAVLPAAAVTIRNTDTSQEFKLSSNELGQFVSPPLPPGPYDVSAEKAGF